MHEDEWQIRVELDDEEHGYSLGERLRALNLDDKARERIGRGTVVTRDGSQLFVYAHTAEQTAEAAQVVRSLLDEEGLSAELSTLRWHPDAEEWEDAALPLPLTPAERETEEQQREEREQREIEAGGEYDWHVKVTAPSRHEAAELERRLRGQGLPVDRRWVHVTIGAPTEEQAAEIAGSVRAAAPEGSEVWVEPADLQMPLFLFFNV